MSSALPTARCFRLVALLVVLAALLPQAQAGAADRVVAINVLSNRADLISGGDALVEVALPKGTNAADVRVAVNGRNATEAFAVRPDGGVVGLLTNLRLGANLVTATLPDGSGARLTITNHRNGGPVFAGRQVRPWLCTTEENGLGPAKDADCDVDPVHEFMYMPTGGTGECALATLVCVSGLRSYDPQSPPPDGTVATTTTDHGEEVPYIIRLERGVIDRGFYQIAVLYDPAEPWQPWAPQRGWNGKVLWTFGSGGEPSHVQIAAPPVLSHRALSRGFAVATTAMAHNSQGFNDVVQAEGVMMVKEHLVETYGEIRYTIGTGCSGGSMSQYSLASNYPGLLDGIMPACSFPDVLTTYTWFGDCKPLNHYFTETSPHLWTDAQRAAATGYVSRATCENGAGRSDSYVSPTGGTNCAGFDWTYHPETNPDGERCSVPDYGIATWGERPRSVWTDVEKQIGRGFAQSPYDTVGIQWGLGALRSGEILPEQFVDLNEKIGGLDIDANLQPERSHGDVGGVEIAYRSGRFTNGREMARVPHIELRGSSNGETHHDWQSIQTRNRLIRDNGHADNMVYWRSNGPLVPDPAMANEAFLLIDRWLTAIEADTTDDPVEVKVLRHKPDDAVDACWFGGERVEDQTACDAAVPYFRDPRFVAGAPPTGDLAKCRLKPLDRLDYAFMQVQFTEAQWERLQRAFPDGVCDYSKPGVGQQPPDGPWMTYSGGPGGRPLGRPPVSVPFGEGVDVCAGVAPAREYVDRDRARSVHRANVDCVIARAISVGYARTGAWRYAPRAPVTRGQMATFIVNTLRAAGADQHLPPAGADAFADIRRSAHRESINRLARAGLVHGVGGDRFAPRGAVSRAEMATFMVVAAELATGSLPDREHDFADVSADSVHARNISAGAAAGLFAGTQAATADTPGMFTPGGRVDRDQMATFLIRLLRHAGG